ncbi:MAG: dihydrolipoyl dehydrogenase [Nitrososphaerota archaeon]|nr:dihydrolipoyl dehydrogenase [Nitrososphaerota archaeon]
MGYDLAVIGAGPAGYVAAIRAAQLGLKVAVVERESVGGECLNWGCIPSKAIIGVAEVVHRAEGLKELGVEFGRPRVEMARLIEWKDSVVRRLVTGIESLFRGHGVELVRGEGRVVSRGTVKVQTGSGTQTLEARNVLIATGSAPVELPQIPFDGERVLSFKQVFSIRELPERLLVVGGGAVGLEMATAFRKLGSEVTVVELMDRVLPGMDRSLAAAVQRRLSELGVRVMLNSTVVGHEKLKGSVRARVKGPAGEEVVEAERVLVSVGKRGTGAPVAEGLGVRIDPKGFVVVDEECRTGAGWIWAAGDATGPPFLAHRAYRQGLIAAESVAGRVTTWRPRHYPLAVFTDPEVASVGMTEDEAASSGRRFRSVTFPHAALGRAIAHGDTVGFVKVLVEEESSEVLGVHVAGPHASELISELSVAIENYMTLEDLLRGVHPHPTFSEAIAEAFEAALGRPLHVLRALR